MIQRLHPYVIQLEAGRHRLCGCGESGAPPLCDDSGGSLCRRHAREITLETARTVAVCACGRSHTPPFCDGRHGYGDG